jgi:hemolysin expression modulating protein
MERDKADWLILFSQCATLRELEICINQNFGQLSECELESFNSAADHRWAELTMGRLYDKIPPSVWRRVK